MKLKGIRPMRGNVPNDVEIRMMGGVAPAWAVGSGYQQKMEQHHEREYNTKPEAVQPQ